MLENSLNQDWGEENTEMKPLFTKSRIIFLISVFLVISMPLVYRYLSYLL